MFGVNLFARKVSKKFTVKMDLGNKREKPRSI